MAIHRRTGRQSESICKTAQVRMTTQLKNAVAFPGKFNHATGQVEACYKNTEQYKLKDKQKKYNDAEWAKYAENNYSSPNNINRVAITTKGILVATYASVKSTSNGPKQLRYYRFKEDILGEIENAISEVRVWTQLSADQPGIALDDLVGFVQAGSLPDFRVNKDRPVARLQFNLNWLTDIKLSNISEIYFDEMFDLICLHDPEINRVPTLHNAMRYYIHNSSELNRTSFPRLSAVVKIHGLGEILFKNTRYAFNEQKERCWVGENMKADPRLGEALGKNGCAEIVGRKELSELLGGNVGKPVTREIYQYDMEALKVYFDNITPPHTTTPPPHSTTPPRQPKAEEEKAQPQPQPQPQPQQEKSIPISGQQDLSPRYYYKDGKIIIAAADSKYAQKLKKERTVSIAKDWKDQLDKISKTNKRLEYRKRTSMKFNMILDALDEKVDPTYAKHIMIRNDTISVNNIEVALEEGFVDVLGDQNLADIIDFRQLLLYYPMLQTIIIDEIIYGGLIMQFNDSNPLKKIFAIARHLIQVKIIEDQYKVITVTRNDIQNDVDNEEEREVAQHQESKDFIDAACTKMTEDVERPYSAAFERASKVAARWGGGFFGTSKEMIYKDGFFNKTFGVAAGAAGVVAGGLGGLSSIIVDVLDTGYSRRRRRRNRI